MLRKEQGRIEAAERHLRRALAADPAYAKAWLELGRVRLAQAAPDDALACLARAEASPEALEEAGLIEQARGHYGAAMTHLCASLRSDPTRPEAQLALGLCLQETGALDDALGVYRAALRRDSHLYGAVVKNLTSAARGRLWLRPQDLRRALLGASAARG